MADIPLAARRIEKLVPGDSCLHATFIKDLSYKYGRYFGAGITNGIEDRVRNRWNVAGIYDYLKVRRFHSLEDISGAEADESPPPWEDSRRLVLFPFADPAPTDAILAAMENPSPTQHPMLVLTKYTLSPVAYEMDENYALGNVLRSIANLISLLKAASARHDGLPEEIAYFGSLSSPDLVSVALPRDPTELHALHTLARVARTLRLAELKECRFWRDADHEKANNPIAAKYPGHACVMVMPTLAFQLGARKEIFESRTFKILEEKHGLRLNFRLRVDCGHESQVISHMRHECSDVEFATPIVNAPPEPPWGELGVDGASMAPSKSEPPRDPVAANWDTHLIHGHFSHMASFAKTWEELWFNDKIPNGWRSLNLLDSITTVSMGDDVPGSLQLEANWEISKPVRDALDEIKENLKKFADRFLNSAQNTELVSIFNCFHSCFFRQDLLGTARDLFPVFDQLARALGDIERCERYLDPNRVDDESDALDIASDFDEQIQSLILHLNRAVRNRIEHRSTVGDPPFPQTLRTGAPKIISAYSFVVYLCRELLRRTTKEDPTPAEKFGTAEHSAACVQSGTQGRVLCREIFQRFRAFVESEGIGEDGAQPHLLSQRESPEWSARLIMLEVPTESLMRPAMSTVHCMHEMAELSDWIMLDRSKKLRKCLNHWIIGEAIVALRQRLSERFCGLLEDAAKQDDADFRFVYKGLSTFSAWFVPYSLAEGMLDTAVNGNHQVKECIEQLVQSSHPVELVEHLIDTIYSVGGSEKKLSDFEKRMEPDVPRPERPLRPISACCCQEVATSEDLRRDLNSLQQLTREILGDIGMWGSLYALLATSEVGLTEDERFKHLARTFAGIFVNAREASGKNGASPRLERLILHRFAIQAAAALNPGADYQDRILSTLYPHDGNEQIPAIDRETARKFLAEKSSTHKPQFGETKGLVALLRQFDMYGGPTDLGFPRLWKTQNDRMVIAFRDAWSNPDSTPHQLAFLMLLWSASTRFAVPKLFHKRSLIVAESSSENGA